MPVALRWADLDAYQHVNNAAVFRLLEEARITAFWADPDQPDPWPTAVLGAGASGTLQTVVARQEIEYLSPIAFTRTPLCVETWISRLGGSSIELCYEVRDGGWDLPRTGPARGAAAYLHAEATLVLVDATTRRPARLRPEHLAAWEPILGEPVPFRRRR